MAMYQDIFRTQVPIGGYPSKIGLKDSIFTIGSCFANHIGDFLLGHKFEVANQLFGTLFNPLAISRALALALGKENLSTPGVVERDGLFFHTDFHSSFFGSSREDLLEVLYRQIRLAEQALSQSHWLLITLGTAWAYESVETGRVAANCHKLPARLFTKRLLSVEEIVRSLQEVLAFLPGRQVLLTVSPVRHLKDSLPLNNVSKSTLRLACYQLQDNDQRVHYFPAYEVMMDELRDYRFYAGDMIHPSEVAVGYICERFSESLLTQEAMDFVKHWGHLKRRMDHRPLQPHSQTHQDFLEKLLKDLEAVKEVNTHPEQEEIVARLLVARGPRA